MSRQFYLVQRITRSRRPASEAADATDSLLVTDVFGYGHLGNYDLDYMGAAEFEWGAIPEAFDRFKEAGDKLTVCEWNYGSHTFDFLYRTQDGEPFEDWTRWAEGRPIDEYSGKEYKEPPFYGKEKPYELERRLKGEAPFGDEWRTHVWWALGANVMWAFKEDGHLPAMLASMVETKSVRLRG